MLANHHAPASNDSPQGDSDGGGLDQADYDIILTALLESARGRSFLEEHARRSRITETATLLTAIRRIEHLLTSRSLEPAQPATSPDVERSRAELSAVETTPTPRVADTLDTDVFEAEEPQNENSAPLTKTQEVMVAAEIPDTGIMSMEATRAELSAIEFLGPEPVSGTEREQHLSLTEPQPEADRRPRDPFADIRALSDEEKIALFA
ncbi:MAG: hypothetical protein ACO1NY_04860 [Pseudorhodoplanes sp.]